MEIMVATSIFAGVLLMMLVLFNYTLRINRRVEALRQLSQASRNFTEFIVREIRNGNVDYTGTVDSAHCPSGNPTYDPTRNQSLALVNHNGDRECFYLAIIDSQNANLMISRLSVNGQQVTEQVNPSNVNISPNAFHFYVQPSTDPYVSTQGAYRGIQPFVTLTMNFAVQVNPLDPIITLPYQTTVSTDAYDTPHR